MPIAGTMCVFAKIAHVAPFGDFCFCLSHQQKIASFWLFAYCAFIRSPANWVGSIPNGSLLNHNTVFARQSVANYCYRSSFESQKWRKTFSRMQTIRECHMLVSYTISECLPRIWKRSNFKHTFVQFLSSPAILRKWQDESSYVFVLFLFTRKHLPCIFLSISCLSRPFCYLQQGKVMSK